MRRNTVALLSLSVVVGIFVFASVGLRNQPYR
jgi:hypothetical protein